MANVLRVDGSVADAYVEFDLGSNQSDLWETVEIALDAASLALWEADSPFLLAMIKPTLTNADRVFITTGPAWYSSWADAPGGTPVGDTWLLCERHFVSSGAYEFYVGGVLVLTGTVGTANPVRYVRVGQTSTPPTDPSLSYYKNYKVGTTRGGDDLFAWPDTETDLSAWTTIEGDVSVVEDPGFATPEPPDEDLVGRVFIAPDDTLLTAEPTWVNLDLTYPNLVAGIDIIRGRQTEMEYTDVSTAVVYLNDTDGIFDPANTGSPFYGKIDSIPVLLQVWNPVTSEWVQQTRMVVDGYTYDFNPATRPDGSLVVANVAMECVDLFDYLNGVMMIPDSFGDGTTPGSGTVLYLADDWQARIEHLLDDAQVPPEMYVVFTGNVEVQDTRYDPSDSVLTAIRDALDAELPGIANAYTDKQGRFVAHGRLARFHPEDVAPTGDWDFHRWKAGDGVAINLEDERAQIRPPLRWTRPRSRIVNVAVCWPRGIDEDDIAGQYFQDPTSIATHGYRPWQAEDLIVSEGLTTGNNANAECALYAEWKVANYKNPRTTVEAVTFRSMAPSDPRALRTWALICGQDISDTLHLEHGYPGGEGISEQLYIEGSTMEIRPANRGYDDVTLVVNVTPASDYDTDVFPS